jgi:hypothetical protein
VLQILTSNLSRLGSVAREIANTSRKSTNLQVNNGHFCPFLLDFARVNRLWVYNPQPFRPGRLAKEADEFFELTAPARDTHQVFARRLFRLAVNTLRAPAVLEIFAFGSPSLELFLDNRNLASEIGKADTAFDVSRSAPAIYL